MPDDERPDDERKSAPAARRLTRYLITEPDPVKRAIGIMVLGEMVATGEEWVQFSAAEFAVGSSASEKTVRVKVAAMEQERALKRQRRNGQPTTGRPGDRRGDFYAPGDTGEEEEARPRAGPTE